MQGEAGRQGFTQDKSGLNLHDFLSADEIDHALEQRLSRAHARQRLSMERDHEAQVFGQGLTLFHIENLHLTNAIIEAVLRLSGSYRRGGRADLAQGRPTAAGESLRILMRPVYPSLR